MEFAWNLYLCSIILVILAVVPLQSAQFKPARCPTNKIAPHRRIPSWSNRVQGRTFGGAFIDLLSPDGLRPQEMLQNDLQEKPQEDDPDDCGEIEDYDETDLSSVTQKLNKRQGRQDQRFFFGIFQKPQQYPPLTTRTRPPSTTALTTQKPTYPTVPPFWSGGHFGNNAYRPPKPEDPSDNVKPVHEHGVSEEQTTYWPNIVGGPLWDIIGASPFVPTFPPMTTPKPYGPETQYPQSTRYTQRPRPRLPNYYNRVFGSFSDLFI